MKNINDYVLNGECKKLFSKISSCEDLEAAQLYKYNRVDEWVDNEFEGIMTMDIYNQLMALVDTHLYGYYFNKLQRYDWEPYSWHYALLNTYTMDGYGHHDDYKEWFSTFEPDYLTGEEREQYDALPDKVTVYRGCSIEEAENGIDGLSWTTDFRTALFFAYRHGTNGRCVVKAKVDKDKIKAFVDNRKESECIIIAPVEYEIYNR